MDSECCLETKPWGYQTPVPPEKSTGTYMTKHNSKLLLRQGPSKDAEPVRKTVCQQYEAWKRRLYSDTHFGTGDTMSDIHATFGYNYTVLGEMRICNETAMYGWKERGNRKDGLTWVKISKDHDVWAPLPYFTPRE